MFGGKGERGGDGDMYITLLFVGWGWDGMGWITLLTIYYGLRDREWELGREQGERNPRG